MADMDTYDNEPRAYDGMNYTTRGGYNYDYDYNYYPSGRRARRYIDSDDPYGQIYERGELEFNIQPTNAVSSIQHRAIILLSTSRLHLHS